MRLSPDSGNQTAQHQTYSPRKGTKGAGPIKKAKYPTLIPPRRRQSHVLGEKAGKHVVYLLISASAVGMRYDHWRDKNSLADGSWDSAHRDKCISGCDCPELITPVLVRYVLESGCAWDDNGRIVDKIRGWRFFPMARLWMITLSVAECRSRGGGLTCVADCLYLVVLPREPCELSLIPFQLSKQFYLTFSHFEFACAVIVVLISDKFCHYHPYNMVRLGRLRCRYRHPIYLNEYKTINQ
jgi:hypothetical protein